MIVSEMIELLSKFPPDTKIFLQRPESVMEIDFDRKIVLTPVQNYYSFYLKEDLVKFSKDKNINLQDIIIC